MLEITQEPGRAVLVMKEAGLVRAREFGEQMPKLAKLAAETQPPCLLIDWTELEGWDPEAESIRFSIRIELRDKFARIAVLAERDWDADVHRLEEIVQFPVRRFAPAEREAALAWLESDSE